jgi:hypothetical protein
MTRYVDATFSEHDPHRRDPPDSAPPPQRTEERGRDLVALADMGRALGQRMDSLAGILGVTTPGVGHTHGAGRSWHADLRWRD